MGAAAQEARFDAVDALIERDYIAAGRLAGAQAAILHRGALHHACFGYLDRERRHPMTEDALFRLFSMTKPITSVAFMMLVEEGGVNLEDPVARYLPRWSALKLRSGATPARPMRVVDLLSHTAGLTYGIQYRTELDASYRKALSMQPNGPALEHFVAALAQLPLEFEPGTVFNYSVATDVLAYLIEKISGESFQCFLKRRIFEPLGMQDTDFAVEPAKLQRLARCYVRRPDELLSLPGPAFETDRTATPSFTSGGGGLVSTVKDYLKFCDMLLHGGRLGKVQLLSQKTLDRMSMNHLPGGGDLASTARGLFSAPHYAGIGFGLGWATTLDPAVAPWPGTPGDCYWSGMANTFFWCDPRKELACVFMTQLLPSDVYPLQGEIRRLVYGALREAAS